MSNRPALEFHNPYPDAVNLELLPLATTGESFGEGELGVKLTFGQQWTELLNGRVRFGIKGGILTLECAREASQNENPAFLSLQHNTETRPLALSLSLVPNSALPQWLCFSEPRYAILQGTSQPYPLGIFAPNTPPVVTLRFTPSPSHIVLTDAENLWRHDISPNKHAILERVLARFLAKHWVNPPTPEAVGKLDHDRQAILNANTDHILQLAELVELNPLTDFAGGNFLATQLNGVDLSGAQLAGINLRGAELNDIDMSEADLRGANLSGADLSGAYLSDSDLTGADLHRASLALANLVGANFTQANLAEANVSNTTWHSAILKAAQVSHLVGLTEEMRQYFIEQGAVLN
ncbi:pentapeptide repeat-containing protein [Spirulina subsalsa FACHB-351]|uniref:Pentapeptide repeat-containing protein n=1 Tax=Spirulina subsalsa FACHB-351 TaxID=234711 RepID=A0ABT3L1V8_9CYAN|nr:pentapeptide repeat-containing protein [Spirulina subsalsa]MCW6035493.1 pentapeptide repeat-containing protein [Spirulina subsalsa FACHB-351]